ncbi:MAG: esterase [Bacteroidetes bacterium OLB11]|nr:MAG: esterase [Bacteroidetes bacterium OLB11]
MRIKLSFNKQPIHSTLIPVRISDINYGGHVGNDSMLAIIHEARLSWLKSLQLSEMDIGGCGLIMAESIVQYKKESFHGDILKVDIIVEKYQQCFF